MSRPVLWPESPIDVLTDAWRPGVFRRWTRSGALVTLQAGHEVVVPEANIRPAHVDVPRYVPLFDRDVSEWRILDNEHDRVTDATWRDVSMAATMATHLNTGGDKRGEYRWIPDG